MEPGAGPEPGAKPLAPATAGPGAKPLPAPLPPAAVAAPAMGVEPPAAPPVAAWVLAAGVEVVVGAAGVVEEAGAARSWLRLSAPLMKSRSASTSNEWILYCRDNRWGHHSVGKDQQCLCLTPPPPPLKPACGPKNKTTILCRVEHKSSASLNNTSWRPQSAFPTWHSTLTTLHAPSTIPHGVHSQPSPHGIPLILSAYQPRVLCPKPCPLALPVTCPQPSQPGMVCRGTSSQCNHAQPCTRRPNA